MLVSEFLTLVRQEGKVADTVTDSQLCLIANSEVASRFVPLVRDSHSNYFVREATISSTDGRVRLPNRAIVGSTRHVQLILGNTASSLPQLPLEEDYQSNSGAQWPAGYYLDAGGIVLLPRGTNGTIRVRYFCKPAVMRPADSTTAAIITAVSYSGGVATCTIASTTWSGSYKLDVISGGPNHELLAQGATQHATSVTVTAAQQLGGIIEANTDYLVETGYTPFVPLPEELYTALVHQTVAAYLRAMAYMPQAQMHQQQADIAMAEAKLILAPRNEGNVKVMKGGTRAGLWYGW